MEVYLSRNHQTCLHLFPLSVGRFRDAFNQPNGPDSQPPHFVISRFVSPVEALDRNLKDMVIRDLSGLSQLNALVERVERMSGRDLQIFSGALDLEPISSPADALRISRQMERYERIEGAATEEKLGRWLVELEQTDIRFPEEVRPYLDYAAIGIRYHVSHGGVFTPDGYVRRREAVPEMGADTVFRLTLGSGPRSVSLDLPTTDERLEQAKQELNVDDFAEASQLGIEAGRDMAFLEDVIPMDLVTVEEAQALAVCILEMTREDGKLLRYCSALEAESPPTFSEALTIAMGIDDYERVPEDMDEYGKQVLRRAGADDEVIDTIDGYMDFTRLGEDSMEEDGVRRTEFGLVRRLSEPFPSQETGQTMS